MHSYTTVRLDRRRSTRRGPRLLWHRSNASLYTALLPHAMLASFVIATRTPSPDADTGAGVQYALWCRSTATVSLYPSLALAQEAAELTRRFC